MSFGAWRTQLRLLRALELLSIGQSVTDVGLTLGYDSTSAFISRFRAHLGVTPAKYYAETQAQASRKSASRARPGDSK
jgi:AraC-like DNA-binding protein